MSPAVLCHTTAALITPDFIQGHQQLEFNSDEICTFHNNASKQGGAYKDTKQDHCKLNEVSADLFKIKGVSTSNSICSIDSGRGVDLSSATFGAHLDDYHISDTHHPDGDYHSNSPYLLNSNTSFGNTSTIVRCSSVFHDGNGSRDLRRSGEVRGAAAGQSIHRPFSVVPADLTFTTKTDDVINKAHTDITPSSENEKRKIVPISSLLIQNGDGERIDLNWSTTEKGAPLEAEVVDGENTKAISDKNGDSKNVLFGHNPARTVTTRKQKLELDLVDHGLRQQDWYGESGYNLAFCNMSDNVTTTTAASTSELAEYKPHLLHRHDLDIGNFDESVGMSDDGENNIVREKKVVEMQPTVDVIEKVASSSVVVTSRRESSRNEEFNDDGRSPVISSEEELDYLQSMEGCPSFAKCFVDSLVTLFCATLLG